MTPAAKGVDGSWNPNCHDSGASHRASVNNHETIDIRYSRSPVYSFPNKKKVFLPPYVTVKSSKKNLLLFSIVSSKNVSSLKKIPLKPTVPKSPLKPMV